MPIKVIKYKIVYVAITTDKRKEMIRHVATYVHACMHVAIGCHSLNLL